MSIHLLECAAALPLEPSWKLVLMAFADSADRQERIGFPGLAQCRLWSGLSRSRVFEVVNELEELGLLRKHRGGHKGRRAEYIVMPEGCCAEHGPIGSDRPDSARLTGSDAPDPTDVVEAKGPTQVGPSTAKGSDESPTHRTPSPSTTTNPPTPSPRGSCPKHPDTPGDNCRRCGTTARQAAEAEARESAERHRDAAAAVLRRVAEERRLADAGFDPDRHASRVAALRQGLRAVR